MKLYTIVMSILSTLFAFTATGQEDKKVHKFTMERMIATSADKVWDVVGNQFADVSKYHAGIYKSELINGSTKSEEGCERVCHLDTEGKRYVKEKLTEFDPQKMILTARVFHGENVPTVPDYTYATYQVIPVDASSCKLMITQVYRTDPAFLGAFVKGKFKRYTDEQMIFIEHYTLTGEAVSTENKETILAQYTSK